MIKTLVTVFLMTTIVLPVHASEIVPPEVQGSVRHLMPENTNSFGEGLLELLENSVKILHPNLQEASASCGIILVSAMLFSILSLISKRVNMMASIAGAVSIASVILHQTHSMVVLAANTVRDILDYGKLLCQVMTTALAAQGCITESSALYIGTMVFASVLSAVLSKFILPLFVLCLVFSVSYGAFGDDFLKKSADLIKGMLIWILKLLLIAFSTYMSITGVVSGTTDVAALKTAKVIISSTVPIVGGILSDSSDAVLTSMGVLKNAAGVYGMLAVLSVFLEPFIKIGLNYLFLRVSSIVCGVFGNKRISTLAESFASAMSILLAVIASACILILISTVCFLKGAGG